MSKQNVIGNVKWQGTGTPISLLLQSALEKWDQYRENVLFCIFTVEALQYAFELQRYIIFIF